jgi:hypothetical protein
MPSSAYRPFWRNVTRAALIVMLETIRWQRHWLKDQTLRGKFDWTKKDKVSLTKLR